MEEEAAVDDFESLAVAVPAAAARSYGPIRLEVALPPRNSPYQEVDVGGNAVEVLPPVMPMPLGASPSQGPMGCLGPKQASQEG